MPTTRAARRGAAAREANEKASLLCRLPTDALGLVLYQLTLAHDIAAVAPTCHALCDAAKLARKLRPFSSEVVTLAGHTKVVMSVAVAPDGRIFTGSFDESIKLWRDGACVRTIQPHPRHGDWVTAVGVLPGGARFVTGSYDGYMKLWTLDGALKYSVQLDDRWLMLLRHCRTAFITWLALATLRRTPARSGCTTSTGRTSTPSMGIRTRCTRWQ